MEPPFFYSRSVCIGVKIVHYLRREVSWFKKFSFEVVRRFNEQHTPKHQVKSLSSQSTGCMKHCFWLVVYRFLDQSAASLQSILKNWRAILCQPRRPLNSFDLQVNNLHEPSEFNINQIGRAWCQSIGKWGQEAQFSCLF